MTQVAHNFNEKGRTGDVIISESVDFTGLLLSEPVLDGLKKAGFVIPSPIQLKAIPLGRCGLDMIVQAKSGTGKTCVFSVIALESIHTDTASTQVLVLAPTREIAVQIQEVINSIGSCIEGLQCHTFIGGLPLQEDRHKLKRCHIAVGSPGRVKQLIEYGILKTDSIRLFILDEADKLLEESFQEQINWIYSTLPENKQMLALSATYPEYLADHLTAYMRNPTFVRLNISDPTLLGIRQFFDKVPHHPLPHMVFESKSKIVINLLSSISFQQCLIFSNLQTRAQNLADKLTNAGWPTACIAGCLDQKDRNHAMAKLKSYQCRVLISTDLTSRGIDADKVNLVINLDIPGDHETYLHRIGRAGRFGAFGIAISLVSEGTENRNLDMIRKRCKTTIMTLPDPLPRDLASVQNTLISLDNMVSTEVINTESTHVPRILSHEGTSFLLDADFGNEKGRKQDSKSMQNISGEPTGMYGNGIGELRTDHLDVSSKLTPDTDSDREEVVEERGVIECSENKENISPSEHVTGSGNGSLEKTVDMDNQYRKSLREADSADNDQLDEVETSLTVNYITEKLGDKLTVKCSAQDLADSHTDEFLISDIKRPDVSPVTDHYNCQSTDTGARIKKSDSGFANKKSDLASSFTSTGQPDTFGEFCDSLKGRSSPLKFSETENMSVVDTNVPESGATENASVNDIDCRPIVMTGNNTNGSTGSKTTLTGNTTHYNDPQVYNFPRGLENQTISVSITDSVEQKYQAKDGLDVSGFTEKVHDGVDNIAEETRKTFDPNLVQSALRPSEAKHYHQQEEKINISELFSMSVGFVPLNKQHNYRSAQESLDAFRQRHECAEDGYKVDIPRLEFDRENKDLTSLELRVSTLQEQWMNQNTKNRFPAAEQRDELNVEKTTGLKTYEVRLNLAEEETEGLTHDRYKIDSKVSMVSQGNSTDEPTLKCSEEDSAMLNDNDEKCDTVKLKETSTNTKQNKCRQKVKKYRPGYGGHFAIAHMLQQLPSTEDEVDETEAGVNVKESTEGIHEVVKATGTDKTARQYNGAERFVDDDFLEAQNSGCGKSGTRSCELSAGTLPITESHSIQNSEFVDAENCFRSDLSMNTQALHEDNDIQVKYVNPQMLEDFNADNSDVGIDSSDDDYSDVSCSGISDGNSDSEDQGQDEIHPVHPHSQPQNPWQPSTDWQSAWLSQQYAWQQNMLAWQQWQSMHQPYPYGMQHNPYAWPQGQSQWQQQSPWQQGQLPWQHGLPVWQGNEGSGIDVDQMKSVYDVQNQYIKAMCSQKNKKTDKSK